MAEEEKNGHDGKQNLKGIKLILLDIEGTICSISYVKDTLFPYAIKALPAVLESKWDSAEFEPYRSAAPPEARESPEAYRKAVDDLTAANSKVAWLKNLQGYLWEDGYKTGAYATPLFPDVAPVLKRWREEGLQLAIYSSGSVFAQKLLFGYVQREQKSDPTVGKKRGREEDGADDLADGAEAAPSKKRQKEDAEEDDAKGVDAGVDGATAAGNDDSATETTTTMTKPSAETSAESTTDTEDLTDLFQGWFDTTNAGPKTEAKSYEVIAKEMKLKPEEVLFFSDNVREIEAAVKAQMQAILVDRPGNAPLEESESEKYRLINSLDEVEL